MPDGPNTWRDELEIRRLIDQWVVWRDGGHWERFQTLWHPNGRMVATWFQGPAAEFMVRSRAAFSAGVNVSHFLGGTLVDIAGSRAVTDTKMTITQRLVLQDQLVDVVCSGRFYDFLQVHEGSWRFHTRQGIYENDRIIPVIPGSPLVLEADRLNRFPEGYRHLAYVQELAGLTVHPGLPGRSGPELQALYDRSRAWLTGAEPEPGRLAALRGGLDDDTNAARLGSNPASGGTG